MANVEKYKDREGRERYAARWRQGNKQMKARRDPDGQPFKSQRAALKYAQEQEADARRGRAATRSDQTVGEYAAYWLGTRLHRPTTKQRMKYSLKHFEATGLAGRRLVDVRQSEVQAWATDRAEVLADSTVRRVLVDLGAVFRSAMHDRLITHTPVVNIQLPEADDVEHIVPLTVAQVEALAAAMPDRYRAMVIVQANLGLRVGELLGLRVSSVDFQRREVRITHQRTRTDPQKLSPLKTRSSKRTVPMNGRVTRELERHIATYVTGEDLFTTTTGRVMHVSHYVMMIATAARKAGLACPKDCTKHDDDGHVSVTSHDLRHHYATLLHTNGLSSVEVGHLLGHRDGTLVEQVYGHSRSDASDLARRVLDDAYGDDEAV